MVLCWRRTQLRLASQALRSTASIQRDVHHAFRDGLWDEDLGSSIDSLQFFSLFCTDFNDVSVCAGIIQVEVSESIAPPVHRPMYEHMR